MANEKKFKLDEKNIGVLPIVNHFMERLKVMEMFDSELPPGNGRAKLSPSKTLGVLLRNLILNRMPLYSVGEWAARTAPEAIGLTSTEAEMLNDDRVGRALDKLFEADRVAMLTDFVVRMVTSYEIALEQFHNDSTTLTLHGEYRDADGRMERGKSTLQVCFGHNKDHRPDLKQLLWILTVSADGAVPVHFKATDGNIQDNNTHIETWEALRRLVGVPDFLYVADSKLCTRDNLKYIHKAGGKFITILPQTRGEDRLFKDWLKKNSADWEEVVRFLHPGQEDKPDIIKAVHSPIPDADGYRLVWFHSSQKQERDAQSRQNQIMRAFKKLEALKAKLEGPRCRYCSLAAVESAAGGILSRTGTEAWINYKVDTLKEENFRQERRGRPGNDTRWRRTVKERFTLSWSLEKDKVRLDSRTDGVFPLLTNDDNLSFLEIITAYKTKQPMVEKRHDLLKNTLEVTPAYLKSISRLEAFLFIGFISITIHALIEKKMRDAMSEQNIESLPLYPEGRKCHAPTMARLIDVFGNLQRHLLTDGKKEVVQRFDPELSQLQLKVLELFDLSPQIFKI